MIIVSVREIRELSLMINLVRFRSNKDFDRVRIPLILYANLIRQNAVLRGERLSQRIHKYLSNQVIMEDLLK